PQSHRITNPFCKESPSHLPVSGKTDYFLAPIPNSKSTAWKFFTDDYIAITRIIDFDIPHRADKMACGFLVKKSKNDRGFTDSTAYCMRHCADLLHRSL
ncbi:MAG: hypothetical protein RB191_10260, partial [Terriglobia bacterium]|nr:hypothetical protein [Terriglobia bacterium]